MRKRVSFFILIAGLGLLLYGIFRGEFSEALKRGIMICLQCIGIG